MAQQHPTFSVCIVTRDRPDDLRRAVESVLSSPYPAHQIVVSDDSTDSRTREMVAAHFPQVTFTEGPREGISANRNNAASKATGTHVMIMDDDAVLGPDFLGKMAHHISRARKPETLILTGTEILHTGEHIVPHGMSFLGFQSVDYADSDRMYSSVINATVFPARVFTDLQFDRNLIYGYDEIDFVMRAVHLYGYEVQLCRDAIIHHFPMRTNHGAYATKIEANRIYVTFKKYYWMEGRRGKAFLYLPLAYGHNLLHELKRRRVAGLAAFGRTTRVSMSNIAACFRDKAPYV